MRDKIHHDIEREHTSWLKTLDGIRQENVFLKNRLAEIIKKGISGDVLEKAEYFHNLFLDKDTITSLLRRDIVQLSFKMSNGQDTLAEDPEHTKLRADVQRMEKEFLSVKTAFNRFLSEEIPD